MATLTESKKCTASFKKDDSKSGVKWGIWKGDHVQFKGGQYGGKIGAYAKMHINKGTTICTKCASSLLQKNAKTMWQSEAEDSSGEPRCKTVKKCPTLRKNGCVKGEVMATLTESKKCTASFKKDDSKSGVKWGIWKGDHVQFKGGQYGGKVGAYAK